MGFDYDELTEKYGLEEDELYERIYNEGKRVLTLSWDDVTPLGGSGASYLTEWNGQYFFTSSDLDPEGPFDSLVDALDTGYFSYCGSQCPEIESEVLPFTQLEELARGIDKEREKTFLINEIPYEWDGDSLRLQ